MNIRKRPKLAFLSAAQFSTSASIHPVVILSFLELLMPAFNYLFFSYHNLQICNFTNNPKDTGRCLPCLYTMINKKVSQHQSGVRRSSGHDRVCECVSKSSVFLRENLKNKAEETALIPSVFHSSTP